MADSSHNRPSSRRLAAQDEQAVVDALRNSDAGREAVGEPWALQSELSAVEEILDVIERVQQVRNEETDHDVRDCPTQVDARVNTLEPTEYFSDTLEQFQQIGRFKIVRQLGQGGYGIVLLAHDTELDRDVALKVPRPEAIMTSELRSRFLREGKAAALMSHPNLVPVFETGRVGSVCYIVSAYINGITLAAWLARRTRCAPDVAGQLMVALAEAVQHAHSKGVIHRDLKPANVILEGIDDRTDDDEAAVQDEYRTIAQVARITDFGLARMAGDQNLLTGTGAIVGTPSYMSPEQSYGNRQVEGASDIYSLGAILYQLLTGRPPFSGGSVLETLRQVQQSEPVSPRRLQHDVPRDLEAICLKCLEKEPAQRFANAQALASDLRRFLEGEPVHARPVTQWQRAGKWCRRNPGMAALASAAMAFLFVALVASFTGWWSTSNALIREQQALAEADRRYQETRTAIDKYFVTVSEDRLLKTPGLKPLRTELLAAALEHYEHLLENRADESVSHEMSEAHRRVGTIKEDLGDFSGARASYEEARDLLERSIQEQPKDHELLREKGVILRRIAGLDRRANAIPRAMKLIDEAIAIHQQLIDDSLEVVANKGDLGMLLGNKANIISRQGELDEAQRLYAESEQLFFELIAEDAETHGWSYRYSQMRGNRSVMLRQLGQTAESRELLAETVEILRQLVDRHPEELVYAQDLGKALANLSTYATAERDFDAALAQIREATTIFDRLALIHPQVVMYDALRASTRNEAGNLLWMLERYDEAEQELITSLSLFESVCAESPDERQFRSELARVRAGLAALYNKTGAFESALDESRRAEQILRELLQAMPDNLSAQMELAICLNRKGLAYCGLGYPGAAFGILADSRVMAEAVREKLPGNKTAADILAENASLTLIATWYALADHRLPVR